MAMWVCGEVVVGFQIEVGIVKQNCFYCSLEQYFLRW